MTRYDTPWSGSRSGRAAACSNTGRITSELVVPRSCTGWTAEVCHARSASDWAQAWRPHCTATAATANKTTTPLTFKKNLIIFPSFFLAYRGDGADSFHWSAVGQHPVHHNIRELAEIGVAQPVSAVQPDQLLVRRLQNRVIALDQRCHGVHVFASDEEIDGHL